MKTRFFLEKGKNDNKSNAKIMIAIQLNQRRVKASTGISIATNKWVNGYPNQKQTLIINQLQEIEFLLNEHLRGEIVTPLTIKQVVNNWKNKSNGKISSVKKLIDLYLAEQKEILAKTTYNKKVLQLNEFNKFKSEKQLADLTPDFFIEYRKFLDKKRISNATKNTYLKNLIAFLNWLLKNQHTKEILRLYVEKFKETEKEIVAINEFELSQLEQRTTSKQRKVDLDERLTKICDLFLFGCYTGLRYSDLQVVQSELVTNEMLTIKQQKTQQVIQIPLIEEARYILEKYNGKLPKYSNQKANEYIKELFSKLEIKRKIYINKSGEMKPLNEIISFHVARKSFITIALSRGMHTKIVQAISGHRKDSVFNRYINFSLDTLETEMKKMSKSNRYISVNKQQA